LQNVTILGSTGTIGQQTLDVIARHPDRFKVYALAANHNVDGLYQQCLKFKPNYAVLLDSQAADQLKQLVANANLTTQVMSGMITDCP